MAVEIRVVVHGQNQAQGALHSAARDVDRVGEAAATSDRKVGGFFSNMASVAGGFLAANVIGGIAGQFGSLVSGGFNFNSQMELVTAKLNAFTKDGAKSAEILEMIKDRASKTPFEFDAMAEAATALLPASKASGKGLEDMIATAEILAASNPAEGLEGAAFALKEAVGGDFQSVIERFNLPRQRLQELKEQGVPPLEAVSIAMKELGLDADLVTNMANTASGRMSTFKDTVTGLTSKLAAPIFDLFSKGLADVNTWVEANQPKIDAFASTIADKVGGAITFVSSQVIPALLGAWNTLAPIFQTGAELVSSVFTALQTGDFGPVVGKIQELGAQVGPLFTGLVEKASNWIAEAVPPFLDKAGGFLSAMLGWAQASIPGWASSLGGMAAAAIQWISNALPGVGDKLGALYNKLVNWVVDSLPGWVSNLQQLGEKAIAWVTDALPGLGTNLGTFAGKLLAWLAQTIIDVAPKLGELGMKFLEWVTFTVLPKLPGVLAAIAIGLWNFVSELVSAAGPKLGELAVKFYDWIRTDVIPKLGPGLDVIKTKVDEWVSAALNWAGSTLSGVGAAIVASLKSGISAAWAGLVEWFRSKLSELSDMLPFSEPKDRNSPLYGLGKSGESIVGMLQSGIDSAGQLQAPALALANVPPLPAFGRRTALASPDQGVLLAQREQTINVRITLDERGADILRDLIKIEVDHQIGNIGQDAFIRDRTRSY